MTAEAGTARATWMAIGIVLMGVVIVAVMSGHPGLASNGGQRQQLVGVLRSSRHVVDSQEFVGADMTSVMGSCVLDVRHALPPAGQEAVVEIFAMMGSVTIRVPDGWVIDTRAIPVLGGIRDQRHSSRPTDDADAGSGSAPRLVLRGVVMMGSILIRS